MYSPGGFTEGMSKETWKKRLPVSVCVVCGRSSVLSIGPPFQVDSAVILTLTPCFSSEAERRVCASESQLSCVGGRAQT